MPSAKAGPDPGTLAIEFRLRDADGKAVTENGTLLVSVLDRASGVAAGSGDEVCHIEPLVVRADSFTGPDPTVTQFAKWAGPCPKLAPDHLRDAWATWRGAGGDSPRTLLSLPETTAGTEVATPPPAPKAELPWPVTIDAPGSTFAHDDQDPDAVVVKTKDCDVRIAHASAAQIEKDKFGDDKKGGPVSAYFENHMKHVATKVTKSEIKPESWAIEMTMKDPNKPIQLNTGIQKGDDVYICRGGYANDAGLACGRALCATFKAK